MQNKIRPQVTQKLEYKIWLFVEYLLNDVITNIPEFADFSCSRQTDISFGNVDKGILSYHLSNSNRIYNRHFLTDSFQVETRFYLTLKDTPLNKDQIYILTSQLINLLTENWNSSTKNSNTFAFSADGTELKTDLTMNEVIDEPFVRTVREQNIPNHVTSTFTIKLKIFK